MTALFFFVGFLPCYYLLLTMGSGVFGVDFDASWRALGAGEDTMRALLLWGPIIGALVSNGIANATRFATPGLASKPLKLFASNWAAYLIGNIGVLNLGFLWIGTSAVTAWAQSIGAMKLRVFLFLAVPSAGFLGGTASLEALTRLVHSVSSSDAERRAFRMPGFVLSVGVSVAGCTILMLAIGVASAITTGTGLLTYCVIEVVTLLAVVRMPWHRAPGHRVGAVLGWLIFSAALSWENLGAARPITEQEAFNFYAMAVVGAIGQSLLAWEWGSKGLRRILADGPGWRVKLPFALFAIAAIWERSRAVASPYVSWTDGWPLLAAAVAFVVARMKRTTSG